MDKVSAGPRLEKQLRYRAGSTTASKSPNWEEEKPADHPRPVCRKSVARQKSVGYYVSDYSSVLGDSEPVSGYVCSGKFPADFARLCAEHGVPYTPEVVYRTCPEATPGKPYALKKVKEVEGGRGKKSPAKSLLGGSRRDSLHALNSPMSKKPSCLLQPPSQSGYQLIPSLTRLNINRDALHFFRPRVQVEVEVAEDDRTVTEVHIRGWKVEGVMMGVLTQCWAALHSLHTLQLWNTALDMRSLTLLGASLGKCPRLTTLVLDNNPLREMPLASLLLSPNTALEHLSLRWCGITDREVRGIALSLGSLATGPSAPLLSLNLCGNCIGDVGVRHLADALKLNRSLLVLNLASNQVSSVGAVCLAEALSWFRVEEEWQEVRKTLIHAELAQHTSLKELPKTQQSMLAVKGSPRNFRGSSMCQNTKGQLRHVSSSHKLKKEGLANQGKEEKGGKREGRPCGKRNEHSGWEDCEPCVKIALEVDPALNVSAPRVKPSWLTAEDREAMSYGQHPLLQAGFIHQGDLWLPGNRSLISLNLSRNRIGEEGVEALLMAVKEQVILLSAFIGPGLLRLVLNFNAFSAHSQVARALSRVLLMRDPSCRLPNIDLGKDHISPCAIPVRTAI